MTCRRRCPITDSLTDILLLEMHSAWYITLQIDLKVPNHIRLHRPYSPGDIYRMTLWFRKYVHGTRFLGKRHFLLLLHLLGVMSGRQYKVKHFRQLVHSFQCVGQILKENVLNGILKILLYNSNHHKTETQLHDK